MADLIERVLPGLERLREQDPHGGRTFAASEHGYRLGPVIDERAVTTFESTHGIVLPADYRAFVTRVGNGGAGPFYGVFRLGEMDDGFGFAPWKTGELVGNLARPFPHREAWNLTGDELEALQNALSDEETERAYWGPMDGAVPICHQGCNLRDWLVVTGPEAGRMWHDATADYGGWEPIVDRSGAHLSFGAWYLRWLDAALSPPKARPIGRKGRPQS